MTRQTNQKVRIPLFPLYSEVRYLLNIWQNVSKQAVSAMMRSIRDQTGTPQNPVDWTNPDEWIATRLDGEHQQLAQRIWNESDKKVNPRYVYGAYLFINTYALLEISPEGAYQLTDIGRDFIEENPATIKVLDEAEGILQILQILSIHSPAKRGDLLPEWEEFLQEYSKYHAQGAMSDTLSRRMTNIVERGLASKKGNTYTITDMGVHYTSGMASDKIQDSQRSALSAIKIHNDKQSTALRDKLTVMDPYRFEMLVKDLLDAMDYEDVVVTKQSGDKGVDVVGNYQFGITQIKEVVQVKRQKASVGRPILDQLRGALPYHQAIRGTIITLGKFAQGCKDAALFQGAAPITLIDGDKLIELLLKHEIGVKKHQRTLLEIDDTYFSEPDENVKKDTE
ncbi:MAG: restriction endonuclease [Magnetococcales bacterium]|nr:restriction endonuclease [Magnetococcales bacterium]